MASNKKQWSELSAPQRVGVVISGIVQIALAVTAWADLVSRPADQVRGPKGVWAAVIAINFFGPIAYFLFGGNRSARGIDR